MQDVDRRKIRGRLVIMITIIKKSRKMYNTGISRANFDLIIDTSRCVNAFN